MAPAPDQPSHARLGPLGVIASAAKRPRAGARLLGCFVAALLAMTAEARLARAADHVAAYSAAG